MWTRREAPPKLPSSSPSSDCWPDVLPFQQQLLTINSLPRRHTPRSILVLLVLLNAQYPPLTLYLHPYLFRASTLLGAPQILLRQVTSRVSNTNKHVRVEAAPIVRHMAIPCRNFGFCHPFCYPAQYKMHYVVSSLAESQKQKTKTNNREIKITTISADGRKKVKPTKQKPFLLHTAPEFRCDTVSA